MFSFTVEFNLLNCIKEFYISIYDRFRSFLAYKELIIFGQIFKEIPVQIARVSFLCSSLLSGILYVSFHFFCIPEFQLPFPLPCEMTAFFLVSIVSVQKGNPRQNPRENMWLILCVSLLLRITALLSMSSNVINISCL